MKFGLYTEQCRASFDERRTGSHAYVTGLDIFYDVVFLAFELKFEILRVEVECSVGVIRHVEFQLVAHRSVNGRLDFLVEIEVSLTPRRQRQCGIIGFVRLYTHLQLNRTLRLQLYSTRTEHLLQRTESEVHIKNIERLFLLLLKQFGISLLVVLLHRLPEFEVVVLRFRKHKGRSDVIVAQFCANDVATGFGVELNICFNV